MFLANLQPPRNIWFRLKLMVTEIKLLLFVNMSSSKCDQSEVHTVSWEETKRLFNYCLVGQRRSALKFPHFQVPGFLIYVLHITCLGESTTATSRGTEPVLNGPGVLGSWCPKSSRDVDEIITFMALFTTL